jgi:SRSO17 transposase
MAQAVPGTSAPRRQEFLTTRQWDEEDLNRQRVQKLGAEATVGAGVLGRVDTGCPQQGHAWVDVARQYSGTRGKVGHCQMAATCCDTAPQATWPVAVRLYLPKAGAEDPDRRGLARIPAGVPFQTTPELALTRRDQARAWGVPHRGMVAEADYGDHPHVRAGLEVRQGRYVVGGRADCRVSHQR